MNEAMYTPQEVAEALKISRLTVVRWCRSGRVKAIKAGKQWRIPAVQLETIMREGLEDREHNAVH